MKKIKIVFIVSFFIMLALPMVFFTRGENITSLIDNRMLTNNPFGAGFESSGSRVQDIDNYISDRIGFRDKMILAYTVLNDACFHEMVHPIYMYGKDGTVFFKAGDNKIFSEYDEEFAKFVKKTQVYCEERNIPFTFAFDPSKNSIMQDKLPQGYHYDNAWVYELFDSLKEKNVDYVDNLTYLTKLYKEGIPIFNQKYNAGHWNDLGAFYGVNNILTRLQKDFPKLELNQLSDFDVQQVMQTSLPVSQFPIKEEEPIFSPKTEVADIGTIIHEELELDPQYQEFGDTLNTEKAEKGAPKILVFQGSYMNGMGYKFFRNAFAEYIFVHDYQNVINLDYYINLFQPDGVVFETAEYTCYEPYYSSEAMKKAHYNPGVSTIANELKKELEVSLDDFDIEKKQEISVLSMDAAKYKNKYVYLKVGDKIYDFILHKDKLSLSILNKDLESQDELHLIYLDK